MSSKPISNERPRRIGLVGAGSRSHLYLGEMSNGELIVAKRNFCTPINCHCGGQGNCCCKLLKFCVTISEMCISQKLSNHPNTLSLNSAGLGNPLNGVMSPVNGNLTDDKLYFVFPYANGGSLLSFFKENLAIINYGHIIKTLVDILLGVEYVHQNGIIHRDLKPGNILIDFKGLNLTAKVADFGLSKDYVTSLNNTPGVVTLWYRAPEVCSRNYNTSIDVWSVGCIFYEMLGKMKSPMAGNVQIDNDYLLIQQIASNLPYKLSDEDLQLLRSYIKVMSSPIVQPQIPASIPIDSDIRSQMSDEELSNAKNFLFSMLAINPAKRPTVTELLDHRFLADRHYATINGTRTSYREYINGIRSSRLIPKQLPTFFVVLYPCRSAGMDMVCRIFIEDRGKPWYKHITLFHAIEVFDRVIHSGYETYGKAELGNKILPKSGTLYFLTCLYFMVKYFTTFNSNIPFSQISREYSTAENLAFIAHSESSLIWRVLNLELFRPTIWEAYLKDIEKNVSSGMMITDRDVASMIIFMINGSHHGRTADDAYQHWKNTRQNYDQRVGILMPPPRSNARF